MPPTVRPTMALVLCENLSGCQYFFTSRKKELGWTDVDVFWFGKSVLSNPEETAVGGIALLWDEVDVDRVA
jgi:hypothetical protein